MEMFLSGAACFGVKAQHMVAVVVVARLECLRWEAGRGGRNNCNETLKLTRVLSLLQPTTQTSQSVPSLAVTNMIAKGFIVLLCFHLGYSFEISVGRDSNVYPLFMNPFDVTHWKCLGYTV